MHEVTVLAARYTPPLLGDVGLASVVWSERDPLTQTYARHLYVVPVYNGALPHPDEDAGMRMLPPNVLEYLVLVLPDGPEEDAP